MERRTRGWLLAGVVVAAAALTLSLSAGPLLQRAGIGEAVLPWTPECTVGPGDVGIGLSRDQARRATTAVAREHRGAEADTEVSDIDPRALRRLRDGPEGGPGPGVTCTVSGGGDLAAQELTDSGLTPRAQRLLDAMRGVFGEMSVGGFEPGGVDGGHGEDSAHYDGRAVDVFYRPVGEDNRRAGWLLANWLVAHAADYDVAVVIFDDRIFSARLPTWRAYRAPDPDDAVLRHLDHVHVDVRRGG